MSTCSPTGGGPSVCGYRPPTTTWDLTDELDAFERRDRRKAGISEKASMLMKGRKESRKEKAERLKAEEELFDTDACVRAARSFARLRPPRPVVCLGASPAARRQAGRRADLRCPAGCVPP